MHLIPLLLLGGFIVYLIVKVIARPLPDSQIVQKANRQSVADVSSKQQKQ